jgi:hypothetical protein
MSMPVSIGCPLTGQVVKTVGMARRALPALFLARRH